MDDLTKLGVLGVVAVLIAGCSPEPVLDCDQRRPDGYGRTCGGDGECSGYLKCIEGACELPPTMSAVPESTSVEVAIRADGDAEPIVRVDAELAATDLERSRGLSKRPCMQPGWAMLFVYPEPDTLSHQTRDMRFAIDLAFVDAEGEIVDLRRGLSPGGGELITSQQPAKYVIETESGGLDEVSVSDVASW